MQRSNPGPVPAAADDEVDAALLEQIPEVRLPDIQGERPRVTRAPASDVGAELTLLVESLEAHMQARLLEEFERIRARVGTLVHELEARHAASASELEELRQRNALLSRANERFERAFHTLKDLTREVEGTK